MARLGVAEAELAAGHPDQAVTAFQEIVSKPTDETPLDGVLMQLGRAYRLAGKSTEAAKVFQRVLDEFPQSPYVPLARRELDAGTPALMASR